MTKPPRETIHGLRAGLAVMAMRPGDVVRVAFSRASARIVEPKARALKARGVPCRMLSDAELDRMARVEQHEGLIVEAEPRAWRTTDEIGAHLVRTRGFAVALDRVKNPYNVGAILRSAAFFGAEAVIIASAPNQPALDPQAVRVAEGGAEHVLLAKTPYLGEALAAMRKQGARVIGADGHAKKEGRGLAPPLVLVVGHEREGLHERVRAQCDELVAIRGAGNIESLNVAVAAGVLMASIKNG
jgi:TrmH RNA methyltransferase